MKFSLIAAAAVLMCAGGAPSSADAGNFVLSIGGRNSGFTYSNGYRGYRNYGYRNYGYRNYGYHNVGHRGHYYGGSPYVYRNHGYAPVYNHGRIYRRSYSSPQRAIRRAIRRW